MAAAFAAPAAQVVVEGTTKAGEAVAAKIAEFGDDPIYTLGKSARKWGAISLAFGIGAYVIAQVAKQADQSYLNDITNTMGLPAQRPPTAGSAAAPPTQPAPAPQPPQVTYLNSIVASINDLGTTSASADVILLQSALSQEWALAQYVYGVASGDTAAKSYPAPPGVGPNLCIAIMLTCRAIYLLQGLPTPGNIWNPGNWDQANVYYPANPPAGTDVTSLLDMTAVAQHPFSQVGPADWSSLLSDTSDKGSPNNIKTILNQLASALNATQPFDLTYSSGGNQWGVLGTLVADLSAVGAAIEQGAGVLVNDVEALGGDIETFAGDTGKALGFIGKVILNLPRLTVDGIAYAFWWGVDQVANAIWLPLVIIGAVLLGYSIFAINIYPRIRSRLILFAKARTAGIWTAIDRRLALPEHVKEVRIDQAKEAIVEAAIQEPVATPPIIDAGLPAEAQQPQPGEVGGAVVPTENQPLPEQPPAPSVPPEAPVPTPTAETEAMLGEAPSGPVPLGVAPPSSPEPTEQELNSQEVARQETLPAPQPTYRERKAERDRAAAENLLGQLQVAFA